MLESAPATESLLGGARSFFLGDCRVDTDASETKLLKTELYPQNNTEVVMDELVTHARVKKKRSGYHDL
jgi:molybdopterin synthase catalytic subunit